MINVPAGTRILVDGPGTPKPGCHHRDNLHRWRVGWHPPELVGFNEALTFIADVTSGSRYSLVSRAA